MKKTSNSVARTLSTRFPTFGFIVSSHSSFLFYYEPRLTFIKKILRFGCLCVNLLNIHRIFLFFFTTRFEAGKLWCDFDRWWRLEWAVQVWDISINIFTTLETQQVFTDWLLFFFHLYKQLLSSFFSSKIILKILNTDNKFTQLIQMLFTIKSHNIVRSFVFISIF